MRRAARTDSNHTAVLEALRKLGCLAHSTAALGDGFPDIAVYSPFLDRVLLLEVKDGAKPPSARRLTPDELAFQAKGWPVVTVLCVDDAIRAVMP